VEKKTTATKSFTYNSIHYRCRNWHLYGLPLPITIERCVTRALGGLYIYLGMYLFLSFLYKSNTFDISLINTTITLTIVENLTYLAIKIAFQNFDVLAVIANILPVIITVMVLEFNAKTHK
jgi:hypothetical protein